MKFLLTNDDGIDAPGLQSLLAAAQELGEPTVVAPMEAHSGCSHRVTTDTPLQMQTRGFQRFALGGTPADCVRVGLLRLVPDANWVLSGINHGGNLGADVWHSGTVAAVREAVLHGWPGIALSHYRRRGQDFDWARASRSIVPLLRTLTSSAPEAGVFWNINLPHLEPDDPDPEIVFCPLDPSPMPLDYRAEGDWFHYSGNYHERRRQPGADVDICFRGQIAVSRLSLF